MTEIWKDINGYEGLYQVSNLGRVRSLDRTVYKLNRWGGYSEHKLIGKMLKTYLDGRGKYLHVVLSKDCHTTTVQVHRLVAETFIDNPFGLPEVNHKDEVKTNNSVNNLEWCDRKYNINYATGLQRMGKGHKKRVVQYTKEGVELKVWEGIKDAADTLMLNKSAISNCCNGRLKTSGGFVWRYAV